MVAKWLGEVSFYHFTLTIFGKLEVFFVSFLLLYHCFVILIKYSRTQKGKRYSSSHYLSLYCSRAKRLFEWFEDFFCVYFMKTSLKGRLKLNGPGHLLMLGANHSLQVIGVGFQLYSQLKKSPHNSTGVPGSTAVLTASQATRLGKGSSVMAWDEYMP